MPEIRIELRIASPPDKIYQALTRQEGLAGWWTRDVSAEPKVGSVAQFGFNKRQFLIKMRVDELNPPSEVKWHCVGDHPEWKDTHVVFELKPDTGGTLLRLVHSGWRSSDGILGACTYGWATHMTSLKSLAETGTGAPQTDSP